jgi:hypothetical protein
MQKISCRPHDQKKTKTNDYEVHRESPPRRWLFLLRVRGPPLIAGRIKNYELARAPRRALVAAALISESIYQHALLPTDDPRLPIAQTVILRVNIAGTLLLTTTPTRGILDLAAGQGFLS